VGARAGTIRLDGKPVNPKIVEARGAAPYTGLWMTRRRLLHAALLVLAARAAAAGQQLRMPDAVRHGAGPGRVIRGIERRPPMHAPMSTGQLARHVELAARYAAQAGVLRDARTIALIRRIEAAEARGHEANPSLLLEALDQLSRLIAPITVADLASGHDPFSDENMTMARRMQGFLTMAALLVLMLVGVFMHWVNLEQGALQQLTETQTVHAQLMLTELRRMAQFNAPAGVPGPLNDEYHRKIEELRQANTQLYSAYRSGLEAADIPYYPLERVLSGLSMLATAPTATARCPASPARSSSSSRSSGASSPATSSGSCRSSSGCWARSSSRCATSTTCARRPRSRCGSACGCSSAASRASRSAGLSRIRAA
jgi:hypothetical protein